jgi:hypothetical protein
MYTLTFPTVSAQAYFENERLWMVVLSLRVAAEEGWSNWSEEAERQRKQAHDALLRADLGSPPYTFAWGTVESGNDPKTGDSQIVVKYDSRAEWPPVLSWPTHMTRDDLLERIRLAGIPAWAYTIGAHSTDDGYVVRHEGNTWLVYHMERGSPDVEREFETEEEAYDRMWRLLSTDEGLR